MQGDPTHYDFILLDAVWHHLDEQERVAAVERLSGLVAVTGICALSLRNGPAGMGTRAYPTDAGLTMELFEKYGFHCIFKVTNQCSKMPHKASVRWSRIVLQKQ